MDLFEDRKKEEYNLFRQEQELKKLNAKCVEELNRLEKTPIFSLFSSPNMVAESSNSKQSTCSPDGRAEELDMITE